MANRIHVGRGLLCTVFLLLASCTLEIPRENSYAGRWRLVEGDKPIAGADILFTISGTRSAIVDSSSVCYDAKRTLSDENGYFTWPSRGAAWILVYKEGYVFEKMVQPPDYEKRVVRMRRTEDRELLLRQFERSYRGSICTNIGDRGALIADYLDHVIPAFEAFGPEEEGRKYLEEMKEWRDDYRRSSGTKK